MCGHVGIAGKMELRDEAIFRRMLLLDYIRGPDSTGIASIRKNGEVKIAKIASHPIDLFDTVRFKSTNNGFMSTALIGHNRAATRGVVNGINAHPFEYDHIVGAHNGTLSITSFAALKKELGEDFEVDSQAIFAAIARFGLKDTMSLLQGAWALVYYDSNEKTLNFLRNDERTLWYAYSEELNRLFWASEWPMIEAAVRTGSGGGKIFKDNNGASYFPFEVDKHYAFNVEELAKGEKFPKPKVCAMKGKEVPKVVPNSTTDPFGRAGSSSHGTTTSTMTSLGTPPTSHTNFSVKKADKEPPKIVILQGTPTNPYAGWLSPEKFNEIASHGCSWCRGPVNYEDVGVTLFERDEIIICPSCSSNKGVTKIHVKNFESYK